VTAAAVTVAVFAVTALGSCALLAPADDGGAIPDEFTKEIDVFAIPVVATDAVSDAKLRHGAAILAEYLDGDGDGVADDSAVAEHMASNDSIMVIAASVQELESVDFGAFPGGGNRVGSMVADELVLDRPMTSTTGFDAALEEVLHLVTDTGFAEVYPDVWGEARGSDVADAMDQARGGYFASVPSSYPSGAWYTYSDESCDYACQVTEYTYWGVTTYLGLQADTWRAQAIANEWQPATRSDLQNTDSDLYALVSDWSTNRGFPTTAPDGTYSGMDLTIRTR
tara:strand:+ start:189 stop:1034 length:846 start_codon:yes stop_codon:yes gene_type:complete